MEDLIARVHFLDATVCTKKFVHLPPKLVVDFPSEGDVGYLRGRYNRRNDVRKDAYWDVDDAFRGCRRVLNFPDLYDGIDEKEKVEQSMTKCENSGMVLSNQLT